MDTRTTNVLSICSGLGGIELGIEAALAGRTRTVCYVENEASAGSLLAARMEDGSLDPAPIWTDLRTFDPEPWRGLVSLVAGGFPCQPHSVAGNKLGEDDPRELSGEVLRIAAGLGYPTLFLENVPGIMRFYYENIRPRLQGMGYTTQEGLFTAAETGAPHRRQRLFILAHAGVDDSEHNGLAGPEEPRGVGLRTRHGAAGEVKPEQPTRSGGGTGGDNELAHAECVRSVQSESQGQSRCGEAILARSGSELAHSEHEGSPRPRSRDESCIAQRSSFYTTTETSGSELAHAGVEGLEGIRPTRKAEYQERPEDVPLYPPGPSDQDGWAWLLDRWPELAPTVCKESPLQPEVSQIKCQFCGSPDGPTQELPTEVLLRAIGNGVVPAVAALAFRTLSKALNQTLQSV